jgi:Rrf2 family transcriptional repressor of oqxAB
MASGRFAMALHALAVLARYEEGVTSAFIAGSVNTHAVFLRRVLGRLAEAGLVAPREGRGGGYRLARPAKRISLAEVYKAMEPDGPLSPNPASPNPCCPISTGMPRAFADTAARARRSILTDLSRQTVADLVRTVLRPQPPKRRRKT